MKKEYPVTQRPNRPRTHPGQILRSTVLPALGMSVSGAAREMGISRQTLHRILAGTHSITPEVALRIGKFCGNGAQLWLAMQHGHDLWHAERRMKAELALIPTHREKPIPRKRSA